MDTDVQIIRDITPLLEEKGFAGFESTEYVAFGLGFGAEKGNFVIKKCMEVYDNLQFRLEDGSYNKTPSPIYCTEVLRKLGLEKDTGKKQKICDMTVYPVEYFSPYHWAEKKGKVTRKTYSIHHYAATWQSPQEKRYNIEQHNHKKIEKKFGKSAANIYSYYFWSKKENGGKGFLKTILVRLKR